MNNQSDYLYGLNLVAKAQVRQVETRELVASKGAG
jgi:hypothetical protein